jgi:hypothetical protein
MSIGKATASALTTRLKASLDGLRCGPSDQPKAA